MSEGLVIQDPNISSAPILRVEIPNPLIEPFRVAKNYMNGPFYMIGSSVRRCILSQTDFPDDVDFLGGFNLDVLEREYGADVLGKATPSGRTTKVKHGTQEIDFISDTDIKANLAERDITISLFCMDSNGVVYDPLNNIEDLRRKVIRIDEAERKILIEPWRIIRVLRFAASLGFDIDEQTGESCIRNVGLLTPDNTSYVIEKLLHAGNPTIQKVRALAADFGIAEQINHLINNPRRRRHG